MRIGLALSGGGFRATLYHLGMVRYLRDANLLRSVSHITSVSGGSVLAAHLVLNWERYCGDSNEFDLAAREILDFVRLDVRNRILRRYPFVLAEGLARRITRTSRQRPLTRTVLLEQHYENHLFGDTCLYQLPTTPELHILCTSLSGGGLSSFTRDGLLMEQRTSSGESTLQLHHVGLATVPMAVTASSAFPGFFPPLELTATTVGAAAGEFQTQFFTDGGVYDNLGIRMFHHINAQIESTLRQTDFVDVTAAMQAWSYAAQNQEATPLSRLAEIYAERSGRNHARILDEPRRFVEGLHDLISSGELHRDQPLQHMLSDAAQTVATANGSSNGSSNGHGPSHQDRLSRNRKLLQLAFQQTAGKEMLELHDQPFDAILASDAGKKIQVSGNARMGGLLKTAMRSSDILMDRVWQLEQEHFKNAKGVIFFPITRIVSQEEDATALHPEVQLQVSHIRTDMDSFHDREVSGLIRHGYCVARQSLALHPQLDRPQQSDPSPWDPTSYAFASSCQSGIAKGRRGAPPLAETVEARKLQSSAHRKYWSLITASRDWVSYLYIPVLFVLFFLLPWMGWRYFHHLHTNAMLSGAITQSRQDYDHLLAMLEHGPVEPWEPVEFVETDELSPPFDEQGLDMISDARITDLRCWQPTLKGSNDDLIYVCRHVALRKTAHADGPTSLAMQSLWDYPDVLIRCNNPELKPLLRRCNLGADGQQGPYGWEVQLDLNDVAIGETAHVMIEAIVREDSQKKDFDRREWWRYELDGAPEMAAAWILLPENRTYTDFNLVKYDYSKDEQVTIVQPTRLSVIRHGTILNWAVVKPDAGVTYSCRWKRDM